MADIVRLSSQVLNLSPSSSSSLFISSACSVNLLHPASVPIPWLTRRSTSHKKSFAAHALSGLTFTPRKQFFSFKVQATVAETEQPKWWEKNAPNMIDIHSTQEFLDALSQAGDRLVIVEFYGTWCASCRALFPKLCRIAEEHPEILFLKVNFDENKQMCKSLNVKVLPYFHFYHGADGQVESFSCSLVKFQKLKDAIEAHNKKPNSIGPAKGVGELELDTSSVPKDKATESTSS